MAQDRAQVAEERATVLQDRARVASDKANLLHELEAQLAVQRSRYQLWKREPSRITWDVLEEVSTDLVLLRSALIIGVSTLPEQLIHLGTYLADPMHFWRIVGQGVLVLLLLALAVFSGLSLRRKLQPLIARQKDHFLPSSGAKWCERHPAHRRCVAATDVARGGVGDGVACHRWQEGLRGLCHYYGWAHGLQFSQGHGTGAVHALGPAAAAHRLP